MPARAPLTPCRARSEATEAAAASLLDFCRPTNLWLGRAKRRRSRPGKRRRICSFLMGIGGKAICGLNSFCCWLRRPPVVGEPGDERLRSEAPAVEKTKYRARQKGFS